MSIQEIKPHIWLKGEIIELKERYTKYPYIDLIIKSPELRAPKVKVSFPYSTNVGSKFTNFLKELNCETKEELIGKEVFYKYFERRIIQNQDERVLYICEDYNVKSPENYELEAKIKEIIDSPERISIKRLNEFFGCEAIKKDKRCPIADKPYIKLHETQRVFSPVCIIDFESYYLNIVLANKIIPENDKKGDYCKTLEKLDYIRRMNNLLGERVMKQDRLKLLVEILIGSLNNPEFCFYEPDHYFSIVGEGRAIMRRVVQDIEAMKEELEEAGNYLEIIRVHTDGLHLRVKSNICIDKILPRLNNALEKNKCFRYKLKYKGYYQRGLFKSVNDFALWKSNEPLEIKGKFFKDYPELTEAFIQGYYNPDSLSKKDFSEYNRIQNRLLENPTDKLHRLNWFLEECRKLKW